MKTYFPIHVHSHFSTLDGLSQLHQIASRIEEIGSPGCALTDHGSLSGCVSFLSDMKDKNKQPILGCELYVCEQNADIKTAENRKLLHMLVFAKNDQGWRQLIKLTGRANHPDNFYYKPRLSLGEISEFADGNLMCVSGHLGSNLGTAALNSFDDGVVFAEKLRDIFGKENFFMECQLIDKDNISEMSLLTNTMRKISQKTGIKCVAVPDAHYCRREDAFDQRILLCRGLGNKTLEEVQQSGALSAFFKSNNFHIPTYDDMVECGHTEEELANTLLFASRCSAYEEILQPPILPEFDCPGEHTPDSWLRELCLKGWKEKLADKLEKDSDKYNEYVGRVKKEMAVFKEHNLASYFLIVVDIIDFIRQKGWLPGPGRGSACGCLISYLIGITGIDPIEYDLLFERFFNASRVGSLPDIDIDVPSTKRDQILQYVREKYGDDHVAQMCAFQTIKGRGAVKDVLRAYGMPFAEMNEITQHIPDEAKIGEELQELEDEGFTRSIVLVALEPGTKSAKELHKYCYMDEDRKLQGPLAKRFEQIVRLEGTIIAASKHAAGIVIAPKPVAEMCPVSFDSKTKTLVAALQMGPLESIGLVKVDLLSLSTLDRIMGVCDILETGDINNG